MMTETELTALRDKVNALHGKGVGVNAQEFLNFCKIVLEE